jgi:LPS sulfotransferase NodH
VICSQPRTGSWFLCEALRSTGVGGLPEEYFRQDWAWQYAWNQTLEADHRIDYWPPAASKGNTWPDPDTIDADGYAEAVRRIAATDNGVMAVKLHMLQFRQFTAHYAAGGAPVPMTEATLRSWFPNPRYVVLKRSDHLRQAISYYRALESNDWWERSGRTRSSEKGDAALRTRPEPDLPQVEMLRRNLMAEDEEWRRILADAHHPVLELDYEDVTADPQAAIDAILNHLEVEGGAPLDLGASKLTRQADDLTDRTVERHKHWRRRTIPVRWPSEPAPAADTDRDALRPRTIVVDNFYSDPVAVRKYALQQGFYAPYGNNSQAQVDIQSRPAWETSRFETADRCPFKSSEQLLDTLEDITGDEIDRRHWAAHFPTEATGHPHEHFRAHMHRSCLWNCAFHVKHAEARDLGAGIHNHVTDLWNSVDLDGWWGIVYLSPDVPAGAGVNIYANRDPERQLAWNTEPHEWQLVDTIANVPNRLVLGRGTVPHSESGGWGDTRENGDLFQTFFFRTRSNEVLQSVSIGL